MSQSKTDTERFASSTSRPILKIGNWPQFALALKEKSALFGEAATEAENGVRKTYSHLEGGSDELFTYTPNPDTVEMTMSNNPDVKQRGLWRENKEYDEQKHAWDRKYKRQSEEHTDLKRKRELYFAFSLECPDQKVKLILTKNATEYQMM